MNTKKKKEENFSYSFFSYDATIEFSFSHFSNKKKNSSIAIESKFQSEPQLRFLFYSI